MSEKSLYDRIRSLGSDTDEDEVKKQADQAAKDYQARTGMQPPEEEGVREGNVGDLIPGGDMGYEMGKAGWKMGIPPPPGGVAASEAGEGSFIGRLRASGVPERDIAEAAQQARMGQSVNLFKKGTGELASTRGEFDAAHKELANYGKQLVTGAEAEAPTIDYGKLSETKTAMKQPKSAVDALTELRTKTGGKGGAR